MSARLTPTTLAETGFAVLIGAAGAGVASRLGAPMPFLLGAFGASAMAALGRVAVVGISPVLPMGLRNLFVAVIGVAIGAAFSAEFAGRMWDHRFAVLGIPVFVAAALLVNFAIFRRIGGYDRPTAFFAAMPGGLIESIAMGERAGCDARILGLQQFSRIALVITVLPTLFLIFTGEQVGSAAGMTLEGARPGVTGSDALILLGAAIFGQAGGRALRLPAGILVGPLILSALGHLGGWTAAVPPAWLVAAAQVVVGAGLGGRFAGFPPRLLLRTFGLAVLSVTAMLALDAALVLLLAPLTGLPFDVLLISFAPGGVTETALIALSLDANPAFVTMMHVFRIIGTVLAGALVARRL